MTAESVDRGQHYASAYEHTAAREGQYSHGMTIREYLAGQALAGAMTAHAVGERRVARPSDVARYALACADELLAVLYPPSKGGA